MDRKTAVEHTAAYISGLVKRLPEGSPEHTFLPGIAMHAIYEYVADYGYDFNGEEVAEILKEAMNSYDLPRPLLKQMIAFSSPYQALAKELMGTFIAEVAMPVIKEWASKK